MRADALARRRQLIDAATDLFCTTHPGEVTLEAVAKKAGVGIATLYRNFADREELMVECASTALGRAVDIAHGALADFAADPAAAWEGFVRGLVDLGVGPLVPALAPAHLTELPPRPSTVSATTWPAPSLNCYAACRRPGSPTPGSRVRNSWRSSSSSRARRSPGSSTSTRTSPIVW